MSDREPIDSLQIDIESSSTDASKSLDALVSSLKKLDRIGKSNSFLLVKKRLQGIASVRFDDLDKQLRSITKNVKSLETVQKALKNLKITTPKIDTASVSNSVNKITGELERVAQPVIASGEVFGGNKEPEKPVWLKDLQSECSEIVKSFDDSVSKIAEARNRLNAALMEKQESYSSETAFVNGSNFADTLSDKLSKLELQSTILQDKMNDLANSDSPDPTQWNTLEKQLLTVRLQYQAIEQQIIKNADAVELLGDKSKKTKGLLEKLWDKFKNVAFYRIVRTLLAQLTRGITAGLGNIAKFSEEANNILSSYKTEFTYIQNSLGAALLPILQSILPVVTRISDGLVDITNSIGMVSAALNGQSSFLKAKKYAQDYADTVEEVKKSTVGFDELNILGNNNQSQNDASQMFEKVDISGWDVAGAVAKITAITTSLTALLMLIKEVKLGDVFTKMGKGIGTAYKYLKNATTRKKVGISIAALAAEAAVCYTSFYDLGSGTKSLGSTLLTVIPVCAAVGVAMTAMLGPVGLVITALVGVTSAVIGYTKAQADARKEIIKKDFYSSASEMAVSLDSIAKAYKNVWSATETLAEKNQKSQETLKAIAEEFRTASQTAEYYVNILSESRKLTEDEAAEMTSCITAMVDNLEKELNTRMESILDTFSGLANLAKVNFVDDLGEMKIEFLKFQSIVSGTSGGYEQTIKDLIEISTVRELTDEEFKTLQTALNNLSALTASYGQQQYNFGNLLEQARSGGIDFGDEEQTTSFLTDLGDAAKQYKDYLKSTFESSDLEITNLQKQNEALYKQGAISKEQYNEFSQSFDEARTKLKNLYDSAVSEMLTDIEDILNVIQQSALDKSNDTVEKAKERWENASWGDKNLWFWSEYFDETEASIVRRDLLSLKNSTYDSISENINALWEKLDSENKAWLSDTMTSLINEFFSSYYAGGDLNRRVKIKYSGNGDWESEIEKYATGGFPEDGLFFANHSELVGKFSNGRTAVANNEQIVEGIKRGVAEAMSEAGNSNGGSWVIQIVDSDGNVKGEKIITATERKNRRDGKTIIAIGG